MLTRRNILATAIAAAARADPLGLPLGCQTWPVREAIAKDFDATLRQLAATGFRSIEMCSPRGYVKSGFDTLAAVKPAALRKRIRDAGLICESCHFQMRELRDATAETVAYARELGLKQMVLASFGLRNAPLADWVRAAHDLNRAAEAIRKAGMQAAFHNHNIEFTQLEGVRIYDKIVAELDPQLVKLQFQVWVISDGVDPVAELEKHPGRFSSLHLQDFAPATKSMVAIGKGSVDWKGLFAAARKAGVKNYYVEMDLDLMRQSVPFLRGLKS